MASTLLLALVLATGLPAAAAEEAGTEEAGAEAAAPQATEPAEAADDADETPFVPTEKVPADASIAFPVDI